MLRFEASSNTPPELSTAARVPEQTSTKFMDGRVPPPPARGRGPAFSIHARLGQYAYIRSPRRVGPPWSRPTAVETCPGNLLRMLYQRVDFFRFLVMIRPRRATRRHEAVARGPRAQAAPPYVSPKFFHRMRSAVRRMVQSLR